MASCEKTASRMMTRTEMTNTKPDTHSDSWVVNEVRIF